MRTRGNTSVIYMWVRLCFSCCEHSSIILLSICISLFPYLVSLLLSPYVHHPLIGLMLLMPHGSLVLDYCAWIDKFVFRAHKRQVGNGSHKERGGNLNSKLYHAPPMPTHSCIQHTYGLLKSNVTCYLKLCTIILSLLFMYQVSIYITRILYTIVDLTCTIDSFQPHGSQYLCMHNVHVNKSTFSIAHLQYEMSQNTLYINLSVVHVKMVITSHNF